MTKRQRDLLAIRFIEIEAELEAIAEGRVVDGDPATVEAALLDEQDRIEYELGVGYFELRDYQAPVEMAAAGCLAVEHSFAPTESAANAGA